MSVYCDHTIIRTSHAPSCRYMSAVFARVRTEVDLHERVTGIEAD